MDATSRNAGWKYGAIWVLANSVAWALAMSAGWLDFSSSYYVSLLPGGLLIGLAQWVVLSRRFPIPAWWIVGFSAGWYVSLVFGWQAGFFGPLPIVVGLAGGVLVGVQQWLAIRRQVAHAARWFYAFFGSSLIGCWLGGWTGYRAYDLRTGENAAYLVGGVCVGALTGLLSSIALVRLVPDRRFTAAGRTSG
jgi:hypothetical protein